VLAAGQSKRMGSNKLLADLGGAPMIRRSVEAVLAAGIDSMIVVTGHEADKIAAALEGLGIEIVHNPDYAHGLATSLKRGLAAVPEDADAVLVCLGDMPRVTPKVMGRLIAAFNPEELRTICVPVHRGQRGNPVLWGAKHFAAMAALDGDRGAKALMEQFADELVEIEMADDGVLIDADTPEALARLRSGPATGS
ncbi:MAG TPA: nucleotidyltransferase family protein, partial [Aestuariivirga sp.]|nr:nucleotidyltransferase family protein [Aestuariivirga sp.]